MPNINDIKEAIEGLTRPLVMVSMTRGEIASQKVELKALTDGSKHFYVTNLGEMYSLLDGSRLSPVENASTKEVSGEEFKAFDELTAMKSVPDDGTVVPEVIGVPEEIAFSLAGEKAFCPITGKPTTMVYVDMASDAFESLSGDDSSEEDSTSSDGSTEETITDADLSDESGDDSSDDDGDSEDNTNGDDDSSSEDDSSDDSSDDSDEDSSGLSFVEFATGATGDLADLIGKYDGYAVVFENGEQVMEAGVVRVLDPTTIVVVDADGNPYTIRNAVVSDNGDSVKIEGNLTGGEAASEQVVLAAETVNPEDSQVRLNSLTTDNTEVAVFVGETHIGTMYQSKASEVAAPMFANGNKLLSAFKPTLKRYFANQNSPELAKFGYVPVSFKVKTDKLFEQRLAREVAKATGSAETAAAGKLQDFAANLELAFVGINKGYFSDVTNDLAKEIAGLLARNGVVNSELEARKLLAKNATNYVRSAVEVAKVLNTKSTDYLTATAEALSKNDFVVTNGSETASIAEISTILLDKRGSEPKPEVANFTDKNETNKNRYASLVKRMASR